MQKKRPSKIAKHTAKDSVFTNLFKDLKYLLLLYQALHRDDDTVTMDDLKIVTIQNILVNQWYNDLGFLVRDRLIILVECQSIWAVNIVLRLFLYLAQTYKDYITENNLNVHSKTKVALPKPELYVIYTGERFENMPEEISLADEFFGGDKSFIDVKVKVIYDGEKGDIINQYYNFTKIYREQVKVHGWTREAVRETIRICKERDILKEYLQDCEKEVVDIMTTLFDQESVLDAWEHEIRQEVMQEARKEADRKIMEAQQETTKAKRETVKVKREAAQQIEEVNKKSSYELYKNGIPIERISTLLGIPIKTLRQWLENPIN